MQRTVGRLQGEHFFKDGMPIYVNRIQESFDMQEHTHDFIELTYVSEGAGVHYLDGETLAVSQGDLFFIPVGVPHVFRPASPKRERRLIVYNCLFPLHYVERFKVMFPDGEDVLAFFANKEATWLYVRDAGECHEWFKELYREHAARNTGYRVVLSTLVVRILIALYRQAGMLSGEKADRNSKLSEGTTHLIDEAISFLKANYASPITLKELAGQAKLSERQFSRLFLKGTGMSFKHYVQNARLEAACRLLHTTPTAVRDTAASVGYTDMKFFNLLFKNKTGHTPRSYREKAKNGEF